MDIQTASGTKKASRDVAIWQPVACKLVSFFPPVYTGESSRDQQQAVSIACRVHDDLHLEKQNHLRRCFKHLAFWTLSISKRFACLVSQPDG